MKRMIALVFVVAVLLSTVFASAAGATREAQTDRAAASLARGMASRPWVVFQQRERLWR